MSGLHRRIVALFLSALAVFVIPQAKADMTSDLHDGQHVLLMRHADAPGYGDPAGYVLSQCSTQRNLGDGGKKQASAIGQWLKTQGIQQARLYSSPWCRCLDTANLLNLGQVTIAPALGSFFDDMSQQNKHTRELAALIKKELAAHPKAPIILVTHHVNIEAFTGKVVAVGDMVLVKVNQQGEYVSHTLYPSPKS
jgi:phosphohistidine phosphatase SixA